MDSNLVPDLVKNLLPKGIRHIIVGSYRREKPTVNDIDLLLLKPHEDKIQQMLNRKDIKIISSGSKKISLTKDNVQFDMWIVDDLTHLPFMKLFATGSYLHNIIMRKKAKNMGYKLNQYGLTNATGKQLLAKNEKDIYKHISMRWHPPNQR